MFPEITCDEVFRLETPRLWLRWPTMADAAGVASLLAERQAAALGSEVLLVIADTAVGQALQQWRTANETGAALHLLMTPKIGARTAIGTLRIAKNRIDAPELDFALHPDWQGQGLMTEAARAIVDAAFMLGAVEELWASHRATDVGGLCVLERLGFTFAGREDNASEPEGRQRHCLDRSAWRRTLDRDGRHGLSALHRADHAAVCG